MARRRALNQEAPLRPPLKWAGGKRWLAPVLTAIYRSHRKKRLVEPFCGGLSVALALRPDEALLNDVNPHPVNFYQHLQRGLSVRISMRNDRDLYYAHREEFNRLVTGRGATTARAAQLFYYLNRTGYNGLCRFNSRGEFNVPFGRYVTINYRRDFSDYRPVLSPWQFEREDFAALALGANDFIYADPPYDQTFNHYAAGGFNWNEQQRLARWLAQHPGPVVLSNQATPRIRKLYKGLGFDVATLDAPRTIACNGDRTAAREVLATRNISPGITTNSLRRLLNR